jgi:hypothetical protein
MLTLECIRDQSKTSSTKKIEIETHNIRQQVDSPRLPKQKIMK